MYDSGISTKRLSKKVRQDLEVQKKLENQERQCERKRRQREKEREKETEESQTSQPTFQCNPDLEYDFASKEEFIKVTKNFDQLNE